MQLPTMVKQMGRVDGNERVYIEDYVYAYLNELKAEKSNLPLRAALFGHVYHRENQNFYLVFGAASVVDELANGRGEEQVRKEYFEEYELIGYVNIYGNKQELPGKKEGYYIFYDKNESMQNYLLFCYKQRNKKRVNKSEVNDIKENDLGFFRTTSRASLIDFIKRLIYGGCIIILSIAVTTINDYKKMHGFVEEAGRAAAAAWGEEQLP
ncbi:hypothetical protein IMSAGC005_03850 [Lachnospiraceae bacterium]|nr:hypothetical protein IMSAGC005_03850 [Lachnospiraceae bacterium]